MATKHGRALADVQLALFFFSHTYNSCRAYTILLNNYLLTFTIVFIIYYLVDFRMYPYSRFSCVDRRVHATKTENLALKMISLTVSKRWNDKITKWVYTDCSLGHIRKQYRIAYNLL